MRLHRFMEQNREAILERSASTIRNRAAPDLTEARATGGLPVFYDQVIETLRRAETEPVSVALLALVPSPPTAIGVTAALHGTELHRLGFDVSQVVHIYGTICDSVTQVADQLRQPIGVSEFNTFNRCLDDAVAQAVEQFGQEREETAASHEVQHLGFLAHELRNALTIAMMALEAIKEGEIGFKGQTGQALDRNLVRMRDLIDRSLTEVRLHSDAQPQRELLQLADIITEIEVTALGDAQSYGVELESAVEPGLELEVDHHLLVSALANLVQNGLKFTRRGGTLSVRARQMGNRTVIDIEDECGGLPAGKAEELSRPSTRGTTDPAGAGLGVAIAHQAIRLHGGAVRVHNLPGKGCGFTIDLPTHAPTEIPTP